MLLPPSGQWVSGLHCQQLILSVSSTSSPIWTPCMLPSVAAPGGSDAVGAPAAATTVLTMAASFVTVSEGWSCEDLTGYLCVTQPCGSSKLSFSVTVGMELCGTVGGTGSPVACVLCSFNFGILKRNSCVISRCRPPGAALPVTMVHEWC
jgi:hypothetical protein